MIKYLTDRWMLFKIEHAPILSDDKNNTIFIKRIQKANPDWSINKIIILIEEYKQFMYLAGTSDEDCTPSKDVDKVWHEHILFTKDYYDYCHNIIGKTIHHKPEREDNDTAREKYENMFKKTNAKKKKTFKKPAASSPGVVNNSAPLVDNSLTDMLLMSTILDNNCHDSSPPCSHSESSHSSCSSHSESSHSSSCSSSSSSCSSSSCGGGGGD